MKFFSSKSSLILFKTFTLCVAISLALILLPRRITGPVRDTALYPFALAGQAALGGLRPAEGVLGRLIRMWRAEREAAGLRDRVQALEARLVEESSRRHIAELGLAQLGQLPARDQARAVVATANSMAWDSASLRQSVVFDRGGRAGVSGNSPALWNGMLIGRVDSVGPWTCRVLLLGDPMCRMAVRCGRSRVQGSLEGIGGGLCSVKYIPANADVKAGDIFVTSGVDAVFPAGFYVGRCVEASNESGAVFKWVVLKPVFDASRLESVIILPPEPPPAREAGAK